ncbi:hypothetical protein J7E97_10425 [Streptomyces sp. ISL-66]|nr:hypothetical protein [Streptomyces sp. ISL-66]MBT2468282.1 hypothetical protein [Streptomyces sp. ISL-66]
MSQRADIGWIDYDELTPLDTALTSSDAALIDWLRSSEARTREEFPRD